MHEEWCLRETEEAEARRHHRPLSEENAFWHAVCAGDIEYVRRSCSQNPFDRMEGLGRLSRDPVVNMKYHLVVTAAIITRVCAESGLEAERAFRLCDFYILKLDNIRTVGEIVALHDQMVLDFTGKMRLLAKASQTSPVIASCIEYIYVHIQERVTIDRLVEYTGLSISHLSRQFQRETGVSVSDYIREKKVEKAQELLRFSDFSIIEISSFLSFCSQSHFTQVFRAYTGMTPKKYRDYHRKLPLLQDGSEPAAEETDVRT